MKYLILYILFLLVAPGYLFCQSQRLELEVSSAVIKKIYVYPMAGLSLNYHIDFAQLKLGYTKSYLTQGKLSLSNLYFESLDELTYIQPKYDEIAIFELSGLANFNIGKFEGFVGAGIQWQKLKAFRRTQTGWITSLGYKYKQLNFSYNLVSTNNNKGKVAILRIGYAFNLFRNTDKNYSYKIWAPRRERKDISWRAVIGSKMAIPLSKKHTAIGAKATMSFYAYINEKLKCFVTFDDGLGAYGRDSNEIIYDPILGDGYTQPAAHISRVNTASVGLFRIKKINQAVDFEYGGGVAASCQGLCDNNRFLEGLGVGPVIKSQLRIGPFENGIELNIPLRKIPPTISFYFAVGINFRKKGKKLNVYERLPNY